MKIRHLLILAIASLSLWSCKDDPIEDIPTPVLETGFVTGKVSSANGQRPIGGALVFVLSGEDIYHSYSDVQGDFQLEAPIGTHSLYIQTGDGSNFRSTLEVDVAKDQTVNIPESASRLNQVANIAYVQGAFDQIQILIDALGYTATELQYSDLNSYGSINSYDIIFLNCGTEVTTPSIDENLAKFVTNGGSLYTSDFAVTYLLGGTGAGTCANPDGFIDDATLCTNRIGEVGTVTGAAVTNAALESSLGYGSLDIEYDLGIWEVIQDVDETFWDVLINDPNAGGYGPLMIRTNEFNDPAMQDNPVGNDGDGWITICHYPPGNPDNPITITINESAWPAHEAHDDTIGPCNNEEGNGSIYFTTFHTHAGGLNDDDSEGILEYIILNL